MSVKKYATGGVDKAFSVTVCNRVDALPDDTDDFENA